MKKLFKQNDDAINLSTMRQQAAMLLILTGLLLVFFLGVGVYDAFYGGGRVLLPVRQHGVSDHASLPIGTHLYTGSGTGELEFRTDNFFQLLLMQRILDLSLVNCVLYFIVALVLFRTIRNISDEKTFPDRLSKIFSGILLMLLLTPVINQQFDKHVTGKMLSAETGGRFSLVDTANLDANHILALGMVAILLYFLKAGSRLEREQELTV